ncbi:MAG: phosphoribosylglycinamide formyltransferase [Candidatus Zambryskibacteria bacterium]|nr:phosphoribosylglycinamide formyltransferase [Candidatus Zambryskibacteria bacterium]
METKQMKKLAVLVSGVGSLLEAMIRDNLPIDFVLADRSCRGIDIAQTAGIETEILPRTFGKTFDRYGYTLETIKVLKSRHIDLVIMAGYMTFFAPVMFKHFGKRITNIHPSLLPAFKGDHAVRDALEFGVKITGTTIHYATEELDNGPIIAQEAVPILDNDTVETLWERIKVVERRLYTETVRKLLKDV